MMIPEIPTTELQLAIISIGAENIRKAVVLNPGRPIEAEKNAGGLHLVLRHVNLGTATPEESQEIIRVRFPKRDAAEQVFIEQDFLRNGIILAPGESVTLEVKPSIGLSPGAKFQLPYKLSVEKTSADDSGPPDEQPITIQC